MVERRKHARIQTNGTALAAFDRNLRFESCRIVNLSEGGALIRSSCADTFPDRLSLYFDLPNRLLEVEMANCSVVRRRGNEVAVRFDQIVHVAGPSLHF
jgi:hypothetical protein